MLDTKPHMLDFQKKCFSPALPYPLLAKLGGDGLVVSQFGCERRCLC